MDTTIIAEIVTPLNRRLETASTQAKPVENKYFSESTQVVTEPVDSVAWR